MDQVITSPPAVPLSTLAHGPLSIALFAGELSGDIQGAALAAALRSELDALRRCSPPPPGAPSSAQPLNLWGIGGLRMRDAGVRLRFDSTHWGAMGTYEALKLAPRLLWVLAQVKQELLAQRPDVLVLIDFGAFNARLAAWARRQGLRVFYYFPPGSWRRGTPRPGPRSLPAVTDRIATPFPWSEAALRAAGADAHFVGHPLLDTACPKLSRAEFRALHGIPADAPLVCYLPGSRGHELRHIWPAMRGAASVLSRQLPALAHVVALPPSLSGQWSAVSGRPERPSLSKNTPLRPLPTPLRPPATVYDALAASDLAITKSGTATLEAAIMGVPMVIVYRVGQVQYAEYLLLHKKGIRFIGMPNIILGRQAFPELLQHDASPEGVAAAAMPLLTDPAVRSRADADLGEVKASLGEPGAVRRTAALVLDLVARDRSPCTAKRSVGDGHG